MVHGPARPAPGYAGGPQASSLQRSDVDALGLSPSAARRPWAPDVDAPPTPRTWAPRLHQHALACLDDLQGILQIAASRPLEPLTSTRRHSSAAALRPLGQTPHAARRPWAPETRRRAHATGSHTKGADAPVTAPDPRDRGSRIIPAITSRYVLKFTGLMRAARTNLPILVLEGGYVCLLEELSWNSDARRKGEAAAATPDPNPPTRLSAPRS